MISDLKRENQFLSKEICESTYERSVTCFKIGFYGAWLNGGWGRGGGVEMDLLEKRLVCSGNLVILSLRASPVNLSR